MSCLSRTKIKLMRAKAFFGSLLLSVNDIETDKVDTAAVRGRSLYVNPKYFNALQPPQQATLVAHEVLHLALLHASRGKELGAVGSAFAKWNAACDFAVNDVLTTDSFAPIPGWLYNEEWHGLTAEQIFAKLPDGFVSPRPDLLGDGDSGGAGDGGSGAEAIDDKRLSDFWKGALVRAAMAARRQGTCPADFEQLVQDIVEPKVSWQSLLRSFLSEVCRDDYDLCYPDRRLFQQGIYLPDLYSEGRKVVVALDTSGSISDGELAEFLAETRAILSAQGIISVRLLQADAAVQMDVALRPGDDVPIKVKGRGGTDFCPVFERLEDEGYRASAVIYMTDLAGTFPDKAPQTPVLWIVPSDALSYSVGEPPEVPFGTTVVYESAEANADVASAGGALPF